MEKLQYHLRRGSMIVIAVCGLCAIVGTAMLAGWGLAEITMRFF